MLGGLVARSTLYLGAVAVALPHFVYSFVTSLHHSDLMFLWCGDPDPEIVLRCCGSTDTARWSLFFMLQPVLSDIGFNH